MQVISSVAISRIVDKAGLKLLVVGLIAECAATVAFIFPQEYFAWLLARAAQVRSIGAHASLQFTMGLFVAGSRLGHDHRLWVFTLAEGVCTR